MIKTFGAGGSTVLSFRRTFNPEVIGEAMILLLISFLAGSLTICSPCIMPILPFVFSRAGQPFFRTVLPMLVSLALTFAGVATLAATGGSWVLGANEVGRALAFVLLFIFGLTLLSSELASKMAYPIVSLGNRLLSSAEPGGTGMAGSLLVGIATGMLWAPCAGPILGLVLTGAALHGTNWLTAACLSSYAIGAASSLGLALAFGGRLIGSMRRWGLVMERVRQIVGIAILASVVTIFLGWDTGILATLSFGNTARWEEHLLRIGHASKRDNGVQSTNSSVSDSTKIIPATFVPGKVALDQRSHLPIEGKVPDLNGAVSWLNSPPLDKKQLRGKVILIDFWTYSCINCIRTLPFVRAWAEKYKDQSLIVIGVHTPEFAFEKNVDNVQNAVRSFRVTYPVAVDSDYRIWRAFDNQYWPAMYFVDGAGRIRHHVFGEGDYQHSENVIKELLAEARGTDQTDDRSLNLDAPGAEVASDAGDVHSGETYVGYEQAKGFISPGGLQHDREHVYTTANPGSNDWGLTGSWNVHSQYAVESRPGAGMVFRFHARDLHLVLGPRDDGKPVRFRVTLDGESLGNNHGADVDTNGNGVVSATRLYQLVRQSGPIRDRTFRIEFLEAGAEAYVFTFG